jgi:hypothetical protein
VRIDLAAWEVDLDFPLGADPFFGPFYAEDLEVRPGDSEVVAVALERRSVSPRHGGVAVFDQGVRLPAVTPDHTGSNRLVFDADPSILYGYNNESTEHGLRTMRVDASGATVLHVAQGLLASFSIDIAFAGGLIFASSGRVIDPFGPTVVGTFSPEEAFLAVAPEPAADRAHFLADPGDDAPSLESFELSTFRALRSLPLGLLPGEEPVGRLVRWGDDAFAFRTSQNRLYLVRAEDGPPPCAPDEWTLCLPDPGNRRFRVRVSFDTSQGGGLAGAAPALPLATLGVARGGLFTFFSPDNPEMLLKVLDACTLSGSFWVFYAATTNVGFEVEVLDTATANAWRHANPDLHAADPVQDLAALPCP